MATGLKKSLSKKMELRLVQNRRWERRLDRKMDKILKEVFGPKIPYLPISVKALIANRIIERERKEWLIEIIREKEMKKIYEELLFEVHYLACRTYKKELSKRLTQFMVENESKITTLLPLYPKMVEILESQFLITFDKLHDNDGNMWYDRYLLSHFY